MLSQAVNPQTTAWDHHAPVQAAKVPKPKRPVQPLPLDQALSEIRESTAAIIDFKVMERVDSVMIRDQVQRVVDVYDGMTFVVFF
jgi:hypothetical protein